MKVTAPKRWIGRLAKTILHAAGWRIEGAPLEAFQAVIIGAPHTSYWDLPLFLLGAAVLSDGFTTTKVSWIGKHTAFVGPLDPLFRFLGGIPVNRGAGQHVVKPLLRAFEQNARLALVMSPEGTTRKVDYWKPGFYYIARLAHVPIVCGFIDYRSKTVGLGPSVMPSGDIEADMQVIREFYRHVTGKYPERVGPVRLARTQPA